MGNRKKTYMGRSIIVFLLIMQPWVSFSQKVCCPLRKFEYIKPDSSINIIAEPTLGIGFTSNNDSVFAVFDGIISSIIKLNEKKYSITLKSSKKIQITYNFVSEITDCEIGKKIKRGEIVGRLSRKNETNFYFLNIVIKKKYRILNKQEHFNFFQQYCSAQN